MKLHPILATCRIGFSSFASTMAHAENDSSTGEKWAIHGQLTNAPQSPNRFTSVHIGAVRLHLQF